MKDKRILDSDTKRSNIKREYGKLTLNASSQKETDKRAEFEGRIVTNEVSDRWTQMTEGALRSYARDAGKGNGVPVLREHSPGQPIGRSLSGRYDTTDKAVYSKFYIQKGLNLRSGGIYDSGGYSNTDDYIASAQEGTATDLSVGVYVNDMSCSRCGSEMKSYSFFGMTFTECSNNHYPGQKYYIDRKGKQYDEYKSGRKEVRTIGYINEAELAEFSLVGFGAIPGSEIVQNIKEAYHRGKLEEKHMEQLSNRYSMYFKDGEVILPITARQTTKNRSDSKMDQAILEQQLKDKDELIEKMRSTQATHDDELNRLETEKVEFESELDELRPVKNQLDDANAKIDELENEIKEYRVNSHKIELYNKLVTDAVEEAVYHFKRVNTNVTLQQEEDERERLARIDNYDTIKVWGDQYRMDAAKKYRRTKNVPTGTDPGSFDNDRLT